MMTGRFTRPDNLSNSLLEAAKKKHEHKNLIINGQLEVIVCSREAPLHPFLKLCFLLKLMFNHVPI